MRLIESRQRRVTLATKQDQSCEKMAFKSQKRGISAEAPSKRHNRHPAQEEYSASANKKKEKDAGFMSGLKSFMGILSKNEQKQRVYLSTKSIKLPKNFASQILDQEYKVDSAACDFESVNTLLQMYSVSLCLIPNYLQRAVEYYSGINDEKYIYFTERIQNLLCRPDVLQMMNSRNNAVPLSLG